MFLRALILGAFYLAVLTGMEFGTRFLLDRLVIYDIEMARYARELKQEDENPKIGHIHIANGHAHLMGVDVRTNSKNLRDDEVPATKDAYRIIFLGDSLTLGWGVEKQEIFELRLEKALNMPNRPVEIINFGIGNYNTEQEVYRFSEAGLNYLPDQVVLFYFLNDAEPTPKKSNWSFLQNSELFSLVWSSGRRLYSRLFVTGDFASYYHGLYDTNSSGWQAVPKALQKLSRLCQERHIKLQTVILPELHDLQNYPFRKEHQMVRDELKKLNIETLDLLDTFAGVRSPEKLWVAADDAHPNAAAHKIIADGSLNFIGKEVVRWQRKKSSF